MTHLAGTRVPAGLGYATIYPDIDFETYSEAGFVWDAEAGKYRGPPNSPQGKKGLPVVGTANYARHPSTEVLTCWFDLKDGHGPEFWRPGFPPPRRLLDHIQRGGLIEAHNSGFEWWIWNEVCTRRYGWPALPLEQLRCSMAKGRASNYPGGLAMIGEVLGIPDAKDKEGKRLLDLFSTPRNPTKTDPRYRIRPLWSEADEAVEVAALVAGGVKPTAAQKLVESQRADSEALSRYNLRDIVAEAQVSERVPDIPDGELQVWLTDQRINRRGIAIDVPAVHAACALLDQAEATYGAEMQRITGGILPTEVGKILGWLHARGVHLDSLDEDAVDAALDGPLEDDCRRVLEIRSLAGSASVKKVRAMRNAVTAEGRLHELYSYHAARTGRPTGNGAQPANLPRSGPDCWHCDACGHYHNVSHGSSCPWCGAAFDRTAKRGEWSPGAMKDAITTMLAASLPLLEFFYTDALHAIAGTLRGLFVAKPGHRFISSDFSAIEGVVIAAIAGEKWRMEVFHGHGKIYEMSAAKILGIPFQEFLDYKAKTGKHHPARQMPGKVAELGLGFGGWVGAWKAFGGPGTDDEIKANIIAWRDASPAIVHLWGGQRRNWQPCLFGLEGAAVAAVQEPGQWKHVFRLDETYSGVSYICHDDKLYCRLPSGRLMTYHAPRLRQAEQEWRGLSLSVEGYNTNPKNGPVGWIRMDTYSGKLAENVVQATARDIQMHAIENLERAGYPIVMHTYDEVVAEVPEGFGSVEELERLMMDTPEWAKGWPIKAAGGWMDDRYQKA